MKWTIGVALVALSVSPAMAQTAIQTAFNCGCCEPSCGCEEPSCCCDEPSCGCEDPSCCCEPSCGCDDCCDGCGCGDGCGCCDCCGLGDPCTLSEHLCGCDPWFTIAGWTQIGYHSDNVRLSQNKGDVLSFNDVPDGLRLHQQYLYLERVADGSNGLDFGFRFDMLYGTDAQKTQAFGNDDNTWDNSLDHGYYGWAMPQAYVQMAAGDFSVIAGHFYTLIGYEVIPAPQNFFYSHALTMFNSEPFTHTGVLGTYSGIDNVTLYGGWTLGWDTGFDQYNQNGASGSSFLGGFGLDLTDDVSFTYICTAGDFGARSDATTYGGPANTSASGYSHSMVFNATVAEDLNYIFQSDMVSVRGGVGHDQVGINQYLIYSLTDTVGAGARAEWWKTDGVSFQEITVGLNIKPHANVVIRPEVRWDWTESDAGAQAAGFANAGDYNNTVFGVDGILTF